MGKKPVPIRLYRWLLAQLAILLLWAPWLRPLLHQAAGVDREFWLPAPTRATLGATLNTFLSAFLPQHAAWWGLAWIACGVLLTAGICALRHRPASLALLVTFFFTPLVGELVVSLRRPIFYTRTLIWASLPLYLLLAVGAVAGGSLRPTATRNAWHRRVLAWLAPALLIAANTRSLHNYYTSSHKEPWDRAAQLVSQQAQPGDLILFNASWAQLPFDFYFDPPVAVVAHGLPVDLFGRGVLEPKMTEQDRPHLEALLHGHTRAWLVYSHNWYTDPEGLIPAALAQHGRLVDRHSLPGIEVYRYRLSEP